MRWLGGPFDGEEVRGGINETMTVHIASMDRDDQRALTPEQLPNGEWVVRFPDDFEWGWTLVEGKTDRVAVDRRSSGAAGRGRRGTRRAYPGGAP